MWLLVAGLLQPDQKVTCSHPQRGRHVFPVIHQLSALTHSVWDEGRK